MTSTLSAYASKNRPRVESTAEVVLDCRWLGRGGVGMTTELTLRAFSELHASGELNDRMTLRGDPERLRQYAWNGSTIEPDRSDPHRYLGQNGWQRDDGRLELAFHQFRPLSRRPRLQWLHDAIPLHFAKNAGERALRLRYLRRIVQTSDALLVDSQHTARCAIEELNADVEKIRQITFPVDSDLAKLVAARRELLEPEDRLLYVGRFAAHKNTKRLVAAFEISEFARNGGRLHLVGGSDAEISAMNRSCVSARSRIVIEGSVPRGRIVDLLASSAGLIQPSLEEGFGLPVWEARTVGLPVIAANAGSLPELITDATNLFDPRDVNAMSFAIDRLLLRGSRTPNEPPPTAPDLLAFGRDVLAALTAARDASPGARRG